MMGSILWLMDGCRWMSGCFVIELFAESLLVNPDFWGRILERGCANITQEINSCV